MNPGMVEVGTTLEIGGTEVMNVFTGGDWVQAVRTTVDIKEF